MRIHPGGGVHAVGDTTEIVGEGDAVSVTAVVCSAGACVNVGVGKLSGSVGGICVGVAEVGKVSASERKIPPRTNTTETIAMMTPPPNWRRACMASSPVILRVHFWRLAEGH